MASVKLNIEIFCKTTLFLVVYAKGDGADEWPFDNGVGVYSRHHQTAEAQGAGRSAE